MELLNKLRFTLSERMRTYRQKTVGTQHDLAAAMGLSASAIRGWEQMTRWPDPEDIEKMAEIFGCTVQDLLGGSPRQVSPKEALEIISEALEKPTLSAVPAVDPLGHLSDHNRKVALRFISELAKKQGLNAVKGVKSSS